jgi:imidazole glycerol-phosphate synthase subunit HisH
MIAVLKYNAGNVQSVLFALERLGIDAVWSDDPDVLYKADKVIFPGDGEASSTMRYLQEHGLDEVIRVLRQPVFGICIGQQLFCAHSEENDTRCLGINPVQVRRFDQRANPQLKVPHMGWNTIRDLKGPLFRGIPEDSYVYFVHSYYAEMSEDTIATADYGLPFSAALQRDNFFAVQFHTEKSGETGQKILQNFLNL